MPDRITTESVVFFVQEHQRRLDQIETRTEDLNVIRNEVSRCSIHVNEVRATVDGIEKKMSSFATVADVGDLRKALYTFALSLASAAVICSLTLWAVLGR